MKLTKGKLYIIVFNIGGEYLTFTCKIISSDDNFVTFTDKFGKELIYNKNTIISIQGVEND